MDQSFLGKELASVKAQSKEISQLAINRLKLLETLCFSRAQKKVSMGSVPQTWEEGQTEHKALWFLVLDLSSQPILMVQSRL